MPWNAGKGLEVKLHGMKLSMATIHSFHAIMMLVGGNVF